MEEKDGITLSKPLSRSHGLKRYVDLPADDAEAGGGPETGVVLFASGGGGEPCGR